MAHAIDHCGMRDQIKAKMKSADFKEAVLARVGKIIDGINTGKSAQAHALPGVELVAQAVAAKVVAAGAAQVYVDVTGEKLDDFATLASSQHISGC